MYSCAILVGFVEGRHFIWRVHGQHLRPSLKLTFPFLFNLHYLQSTLDFESVSTFPRVKAKG